MDSDFIGPEKFDNVEVQLLSCNMFANKHYRKEFPFGQQTRRGRCPIEHKGEFSFGSAALHKF